MLKFLQFIIWLIGAITIVYFVMQYYGYEFDSAYVHKSKTICMQEIKDCRNEVMMDGLKNAHCEFNCIDPDLIIIASDKK